MSAKAVDKPALSAHLEKEGHPQPAARSCGWVSLGRGWPGTPSAHIVQNSALPWGRAHSGSPPVVFQDRLGVALSLFGAWPSCKQKANLLEPVCSPIPINAFTHTDTQPKAYGLSPPGLSIIWIVQILLPTLDIYYEDRNGACRIPGGVPGLDQAAPQCPSHLSHMCTDP